MQAIDRKRFSACLMGAAEIHGKVFSDAVVKLWWDALNGYSIEEVETAFMRHLSSPDTGQFMPKPADVIRMIEGTSVDTAMLAWTKVGTAFLTVGPYRSVTFDDPIIMRVIQEMNGWTGWQTVDDDQWPFIANEFRTRYKGHKSHGDIPDYPSRISGIAEIENAAKGLATTPDHVLIGDARVAGAVAMKGSRQPLVSTTSASNVQVLGAVSDVLKKITVRKL